MHTAAFAYASSSSPSTALHILAKMKQKINKDIFHYNTQPPYNTKEGGPARGQQRRLWSGNPLKMSSLNSIVESDRKINKKKYSTSFMYPDLHKTTHGGPVDGC